MHEKSVGESMPNFDVKVVDIEDVEPLTYGEQPSHFAMGGAENE